MGQPLHNLDAELRHLVSNDGAHIGVTDLKDASGLLFLCPKCGTHSILVWFQNAGVPDSLRPGPDRWQATGTSIDDLSLTPSINLDTYPTHEGVKHACDWHGWVLNGRAS